MTSLTSPARVLTDISEPPELDLILSGFEEKETKQLIRSLDAREKRGRAKTFALRAAYENPRLSQATSSA